MAAALVALAVIAAETHGTSPFYLYFDGMYFVADTRQVALIFGVVSAAVCFSALCFTPHKPNHFLGLGGFGLAAFSSSVLLVLSAFKNGQDSPTTVHQGPQPPARPGYDRVSDGHTSVIGGLLSATVLTLFLLPLLYDLVLRGGVYFGVEKGTLSPKASTR